MALIFEQESNVILDACRRVHSGLGCGFLEAVYQEALERVFQKSGIPYVREALLPIRFEGELLSKYYQADFVCYGKIILELKAISGFLPEHRAAVLNYLKATGLRVAYLVNFGRPTLHWERMVAKNEWIAPTGETTA